MSTIDALVTIINNPKHFVLKYICTCNVLRNAYTSDNVCTVISRIHCIYIRTYRYVQLCIYIILDCSRRVVRDVVFVIDTSSSIGYTRFQLARELTEDIATRIKVNSPETLFGLVTFDDNARFEFNISTHTDLSTLLSAINPGLTYYGGYSTNTASALSLLLSGGVEGGYLQLRDKTPNVAILITDGYSSNSSSLRSTANSLHAVNIFDVYAVGIGNNSYSELQLIASDPSFVFSIDSLSSITAQQLVDDVVEQLCSSK